MGIFLTMSGEVDTDTMIDDVALLSEALSD